jgi:ABC-type multidrug transport system fused ATPase/permease subunit
MKLRTVPALHGAVWVRQGFRAFFKRPIAFAALFAAFMFVVFVLALLPFVGPLLMLTLLPLVSLGFMLGTRMVVGGGQPTPAVFVAPLRAEPQRVRSMLWLGLIYAIATFVVMWLSEVADGGAFEALMDALPAAQTAPDVVAEKLAAPGLMWGLLLRFGLAGLLSVPFWHAPALVFWDGQRCAQALFSSTLACWRNRGAFVVYSLTWFALIVAFGIVASMAFAVFGSPQMFAVAGVPSSLLITTVFYASLYFTFADSFSADDAESALT